MTHPDPQLPRFLVVEIAWADGSIPRCETYGPWGPGDAQVHQQEMYEFVQEWQTITGCEPQRVTLISVQEPGQALVNLRAYRDAKA